MSDLNSPLRMNDFDDPEPISANLSQLVSNKKKTIVNTCDSARPSPQISHRSTRRSLDARSHPFYSRGKDPSVLLNTKQERVYNPVPAFM